MPSIRSIVTSTEMSNIPAYLRGIGTAKESGFCDWGEPIPPK